LQVEVHEDHFAQDARDEDWLPKVGRRGWTVLMKDKQIRRTRLEREALLAAGVRAFVLTAGNLTGPEQAEVFARQIRRIARMALNVPAPFVAGVSRDGIVLYRV